MCPKFDEPARGLIAEAFKVVLGFTLYKERLCVGDTELVHLTYLDCCSSAATED